MVDRLAEDHQRAHRLALGIAEIPGLVTDVTTQETNMVYFSIAEGIPITTSELANKVAQYRLKIDASEKHRIRLVTHYWIDDKDIEQTLEILETVMASL
jgi:threonine aldolase